ncbi:hypothetical protein [Saccharopolyspora pogona]|uniref:hypothetical protein n=1 Tax=Saccharopolyspora pogona TaxID=333966 RepID=UPI0016847C64|nr:hypothetical protein [Saccharopolyspora pogona]
MATEKQYRELFDRVAALRRQVAGNLSNELGSNPQVGEAILKQIDDMLFAVETEAQNEPRPADGGFAQLVGLGGESAGDLGATRMPHGIETYDETIASERILAVGDLYYLYQHERIGFFRVVQKMQELFQRGTIRLSDGPGAFGLYRFDRRDVLRYTKRDRISAYRRVLGYGRGLGSANSRPNTDFHRLFVQFNNQVALFWRDKRISDVIRERAHDMAFGSMAVVRRSGLDLRNNLKFTSYGHLNVLRVEVMQLLEECFQILDAEDVKDLFGAANAWDVVDEVLIRYFDDKLVTSPRQRMAVTGRNVLRWLAAPHILETTRSEFEALLLEIAEPAEEWITSAQSLRLADRTGSKQLLPWDRQQPAGVATPSRGDRPEPARSRQPVLARRARLNGHPR